MTGKIVSIVVYLGDKVNAEDEVVIMEATWKWKFLYIRPKREL